MAQPTPRLVLRDLSPATRAVLAVFLVSVGVGYLSALVQLSSKHGASFGDLPTPDDAKRIYGGQAGVPPIEHILGTSVLEKNPGEERFDRGHMSPAFTVESVGWRAVAAGGPEKEKDARKEREAERLALLDWVRAGCPKDAYVTDSYAPSEDLAGKLKGGQLKVPESHAVRGPGQSTLERLLGKTFGHMPFGSLGSMREAFFSKSSGWKALLKKRAADLLKLHQEREGEAEAIIAWSKAAEEPRKKAYEDDDFALPPPLDKHPLTDEFLVENTNHVKIKTLIDTRCVKCHKEGTNAGSLEDYEHVVAYTVPEPESKTGPVLEPTRIKIHSLIQDRCVRCHQDAPGADERARQIPLDGYESFCSYCKPETTPTMSFSALAQSTHAHLLAFSVLFALTGLVVSFTSWPGWIRFVLAPMTLLAQVTEIGFWWLSRVDPRLSLGIVVCGGIVGASLLFQILFGLLDLAFGKRSATLANGNGVVT